jgi:ribosome modulation factor
MANPQAGSNTASNELKADFIRQYRLQKRKCDEEQGVLRSIAKAAKSNGMTLKALTNTVAATKMDPEQAVSELRDQIHYMALVRLPVTKDSLFDFDTEVNEESQHQDDLWDVGESGYRAGRDGSSSDDCPWQDGSEFYEHWMNNWQRGAASRARELGPNDQPAVATRQKRGRKPRQASLDVEAPQPQREEAVDEYQVGSAVQDDEPVTEEPPVYVPARTRRPRRAREVASTLN